MDLPKLWNDYQHWLNYNFPNTTSDQQLKGLMEELGELAHADLKMEQKIRDTTTDEIKDSVGDIFMYLMGYCVKKEINVIECIETAWNEIIQRDWQKYPKNGISE